jgi:hypothetical protein
MNLARYFLTRVGDRWHVTLEGRSMSDYPTRSQAISAAIVMADLMGAMHHDADVMVDMGAGLPLELVWTYGQDEVPAPRVSSPAPEPEIKPQPPEAHPHVRLVQRGEAA